MATVLDPAGAPAANEKRPAGRTQPTTPGGRRRHVPPLLAISPFYVLFAVFGAFPIVFSVYLSFQDWDGIGDMRYVGLKQYGWLLQDSVFWHSVLNTFEIWFLSTVPMLFLALVLAFLLHSQVRFAGAYRVAYFVPNVTSMVAMTVVFGSVFAQAGLANSALRAIGLDGVGWLSSEWGIKSSVSIMIIWRWVGYNALIFLAGLQAIPTEHFEAARVDGANSRQTLFRVVLPQLRPVVLFAAVTSTINGLQIFTESQVLFQSTDVGTTGGPGQEGMTIVLYLWQKAFKEHQFGYGAAMGWVLFAIIAVFTVINWRLVAGSDDDRRPGIAGLLRRKGARRGR
ncbi:carbohydrate ABC transporter permease [Streptomyces coeruleorubidus]|uniref:Sugar ABC transporter permease n=1 Tax=Streptomyces coeruleorubidus TaxID=116188 RepID=A0A5J6I1J0_STRC4|nr:MULTISPECIES: sugar ABC transporter permease [Streptomyces]QEV24611.1 sugar ABC transporter permease [Streptomyces coeruleorubidus]WOT37700.1 sugar ABC transporter permease [Streptomyces coeruleorubidus]GGT78472.1 cytochrome c biogenesis protein [Streptomyces coeruleorubidus]GGU19588.1 cytochrome c biogenesis protein [Streptomyces bellus]